MKIPTTLLLLAATMAQAQRTPPPIVLGPDDKPAFAAAPAGFDLPREDVSHGTVTTVDYDSQSVGARRKLLVYTPPNYDESRRYPVLYLLHGIGGTEREWADHGAPATILDNLLSQGKVCP